MVASKLSVFIRDPHFQGQTKEKLTTQEAARLVEGRYATGLIIGWAATPHRQINSSPQLLTS